MRLTSDGKLGIGTTSPTEKLEVAGNVYLPKTGTAINDATTFPSYELRLQGSQWDSDGVEVPHYHYIRARGLKNAETAISMDLAPGAIELGRQGEDPAVSIRTDYNGVDQLIVPDGNVGIGVVDPTQKLHIDGNMRLTGAYHDKDNQAGTSGQVLTSTTTGTDWVDASTLSVAGDNLGDHKATQNIDMENNDVTDFDDLISRTNATKPFLRLESSGSGDNWDDQGAYIALGENANNGSAALYMTYVGNGYGYIGSGGGIDADGIPDQNYIRFHYNSNKIYLNGNL